ncbi:hypothetical protein MKX03_012111 [Papaver bracteatum]|nr:hypothetical protein MKX03_012111 [Papaver bracteatum]
MAKFLSILVVNVVFLLLSTVLVSASTPLPLFHLHVIVQVASPQDTNICAPNDVYNSEVLGPTQDCNICTFYCAGVCSGIGTKQCSVNVVVPNPHLLPLHHQSPPPPTPTPSGGECQDGNTESETTLITSNCADCTNWCKEECADLGESKFVRRCKCCCSASSCLSCRRHMDDTGRVALQIQANIVIAIIKIINITCRTIIH